MKSSRKLSAHKINVLSYQFASSASSSSVQRRLKVSGFSVGRKCCDLHIMYAVFWALYVNQSLLIAEILSFCWLHVASPFTYMVTIKRKLGLTRQPTDKLQATERSGMECTQNRSEFLSDMARKLIWVFFLVKLSYYESILLIVRSFYIYIPLQDAVFVQPASSASFDDLGRLSNFPKVTIQWNLRN